MMGTHGLSIDYGTRLGGSNGSRWAVIGDTVAGETVAGETIATWTNAYLSDGGAWVNASDRNLKTDFRAIDSLQILAKVDAMPVMQWLAAIQGLHRLLQARDAEIAELRDRLSRIAADANAHSGALNRRQAERA